MFALDANGSDLDSYHVAARSPRGTAGGPLEQLFAFTAAPLVVGQPQPQRPHSMRTPPRELGGARVVFFTPPRSSP